MIAQLSKIALTDGTNTVVLSNILEGVEGSASFGLSTTQNEILYEDSQTLGITDVYVFDVRVVRSSSADSAILQNWANNQVPLLMSGVGIDGVIIWNEPSLIRLNDEFGGKLIADQIYMTIETGRGYVNGKRPVYVGSNLLGNSDILGRGGENYLYLMFGLSEQGYRVYADNGTLLDTIGDSGTASKASLICFCNSAIEGAIPYFTETDGAYQDYEFTDGLIGGISGQNLALTVVDFNDAELSSPFIFFPFPQTRLGGSIRFISTVNSASQGDVFIEVRFYDQNQTFISASSLASPGLNGLTPPTRINFTSAFVPSSTKYLKFVISLPDADYQNGDRFVFTAPFLTNKMTNNFEI